MTPEVLIALEITLTLASGSVPGIPDPFSLWGTRDLRLRGVSQGDARSNRDPRQYLRGDRCVGRSPQRESSR